MVKLKEIHRPSTFAWSPLPSLPLLATGTVAGALDESFSNNGQLEIWSPNFLDRNEYDLGGEGQTEPLASITTSSRFNRLAWGYTDGSRERGVLVAGMENGDLDIWDPSKIVLNADQSESLVLSNKTHTGPIRGLDFNPIQTNLFASGAVNGEIYIWDLKDPSKPYSPGTRSTKLDEITALAWNHHVQYALAASSSTGYTVVWDLRGKREVAALAYGGGAGTLAGGAQGFGAQSLAIGGRRGMSDVAWHPDNATRLVTSSEDDTSPIIMVWDLRNARAPEKILTGHEKGVLSLSWCKQDADLLLSCGKDNRALCWNPQTSEIIGELPSADNWAFQVDWCPRNPDLFATAFFDGTIGIHSIQSTNEANELPPDTAQSDGLDVFNTPGFSRAGQATLSLTQPPKWLRRPTSASFGYGGKIVSVSNLSGAHGKNQSSVVHIRKVTTEQTIADRARKLQEAVEKDTLSSLAEERSIREEGDEIAPAESASSWKALLSLFRANSRDELITLLGFSKSEIASRVAEAVANLKAAAAANEDTDSPTEHDLSEGDIRLHEPVVSFAEPEREPTPEYGHDHDDTLDAIGTAAETTPSEVSASATSDTTSAARLADGESTTTAPSLFGDDNIVNGTPQTDAAADFFGSIGTTRTEEDDQMQIPHHNYPLDSSVAATVGSRPSSVASESLKNNTFKIYPSDESETDRLVTKALVLGDFESAVSLCLSSDRFADAILLAVRGGPELLQKTQKAYFEKRTTALPYLRLFQSIVSNDLADIVQNADLQEWQEIFVVLCTFAGQDEFSSLAEQLGQRLEFQASLAKTGSTPEDTTRAREFRKNATLTYLAAGKLERLVNIWIDELAEEEKVLLVDAEHLDGSRYTAHALALQTFIEKVTVFRKAIKYADTDLEQQPKGISTEEAEVRVYKLSGLYDRYFEYADLLVAQGLVKEAVEFLKLTPSEYHGSPASHLDFKEGRERLLLAAGVGARTPSVPARNASLPAATSRIQPAASTSSVYGYGQYGVPPVQSQPPVARAPPATQTMYESYAPRAQHTGAYAPPPIAASSSQHLYGPPSYGHVNPVNLYAAQAPAPLAPPPAGVSQSQPNIPPPPPKGLPIKRDNGGWNDAPSVSQRRTPNSLAPGKPAAITSPFPNQTSPSTPPISAHGFGQGPISATLPPPPRPRSVQQRGPGQPGLPPPPPSSSTPGARIPGPPQLLNQGPPPHMRPLSGPPGPPPARMVSPPHGGPAGLNRPPPSQYMPAQQSPRGGQTLPPPPGQGPYIRATPSPGFHQGPPSGPYAPSSAQHPPLQQGSFSQPPQHQQQQHQQPGFAPPPPHSGGSFAPPPPPGVGAQGVFSPPPHQAGGSFAPPPPPQGAPRPGPPGPPPRGSGGQRDGAPSGSAPPPAAAAPPRKTGPPPPKYPPGDRSHIPSNLMPVFNVISGELDRLKQTTPPQQKRLVDDLERRINPLFDALNCETLSSYVCEQLVVLTQAMTARDRDAALAIHVELLTRGSLTDDIGLWMSGVKQLIMRL